MTSASQTLKKEHRRHGGTQSLKSFARDAQKNDKQLRDVVTAWQNNKGPKKKAKPAKPRAAEAAAPAAKGAVLKKR